MHRPVYDRVLVIGDADRQVQAAVREAMPGANVISVGNVFDGIAELSQGGGFATVLAAAEPIERRPEAAVRTLRELAGEGRLVLFGHPTLEPLSRKMLEFGADDYLVTPAQPGELKQMFTAGNGAMRLATEADGFDANAPADDADGATALPQVVVESPFARVPLADVVLDALLQAPHDPVTAAVRQVAIALGEDFKLTIAKSKPATVAGAVVNAPVPVVVTADGRAAFSHPVRNGNDVVATLHLAAPPAVAADEARHFLAGLSHQLGKLAALQERHAQLQRLAITDELTGLYNGRYFRHFLSKILDKAKTMRFPVTLLLFDIDNFKKYNDQFGHAVGDEILRETATLMKRCVREHDCVARISGDEFAVVFWEKEGPRMAHAGGGFPGRPPQTPLQVFTRFRGLLNSQEFKGLGASGQGVLTISGGLAVYPYDAATADDLYNAADRALMFGSKKAGKNTVFLVGSDEPMRHNPPPADADDVRDGL